MLMQCAVSDMAGRGDKAYRNAKHDTKIHMLSIRNSASVSTPSTKTKPVAIETSRAVSGRNQYFSEMRARRVMKKIIKIKQASIMYRIDMAALPNRKYPHTVNISVIIPSQPIPLMAEKARANGENPENSRVVREIEITIFVIISAMNGLFSADSREAPFSKYDRLK